MELNRMESIAPYLQVPLISSDYAENWPGICVIPEYILKRPVLLYSAVWFMDIISILAETGLFTQYLVN
jgi:hypothetical protein